MRITTSQRDLLNSFSCVRLSSRDELINLVSDFRNIQNENLVDYLKGDAFQDDNEGKVACYVIMDCDNEILCYFSLKCGNLYSEFEELKLFEKHKVLKIELKALSNQQPSDVVNDLIKKVSIEIEEARRNIIKQLGNFDSLPTHKQVAKCFPGIELTHFCVNESYRRKWENYNLGAKNRMGATMFWHHIARIVEMISNHIGCEYLYLFAADTTSDLHLVNHYKNIMNMRDDYNVLALQPIYDFRCTFLCTSVRDLIINRKDFYDHFNDFDEMV